MSAKLPISYRTSGSTEGISEPNDPTVTNAEGDVKGEGSEPRYFLRWLVDAPAAEQGDVWIGTLDPQRREDIGLVLALAGKTGAKTVSVATPDAHNPHAPTLADAIGWYARKGRAWRWNKKNGAPDPRKQGRA